MHLFQEVKASLQNNFNLLKTTATNKYPFALICYNEELS